MTHMPVVLLGTGLYTPKDSISNDELVATFNQYVTSITKSMRQKLLLVPLKLWPNPAVLSLKKPRASKAVL